MSEFQITARMQEIRSSQSRLYSASATLSGGHGQLGSLDSSVANVASAMDATLAGSSRGVDQRVKGHLLDASRSARAVQGHISDAISLVRNAQNRLEDEYRSLQRQLEAIEAEKRRRRNNA